MSEFTENKRDAYVARQTALNAQEATVREAIDQQIAYHQEQCRRLTALKEALIMPDGVLDVKVSELTHMLGR